MDERIISTLKSRLANLDVSLDLINSLADSAICQVLNYTGLLEVPSNLIYVCVELAMIAFNQMGAEGISNESYAFGGGQAYIDDIPERIKRQLRPFRKLRRG